MPRTLDTTLRFSGVSDAIAISAASQQSAAFAAQTQEIRVVADTACWIRIGDNPTAAIATDGNMLLPPNAPEYFHVSPGQRVAVIGTTGNFCVAEMTR